MDQKTADALISLRRIQRRTELYARTLAQATDLSVSQLKVMQLLAGPGPSTPGDLVRQTALSNASMTTLVDRLESRGLVARRRDENDRRRVVLALTTEGERVLNRAPNPLHDSFEKIFSALPEWQRSMIVASLEQVADIVDRGADVTDSDPILDAGAFDQPGDGGIEVGYLFGRVGGRAARECRKMAFDEPRLDVRPVRNVFVSEQPGDVVVVARVRLDLIHGRTDNLGRCDTTRGNGRRGSPVHLLVLHISPHRWCDEGNVPPNRFTANKIAPQQRILGGLLTPRYVHAASNEIRDSLRDMELAYDLLCRPAAFGLCPICPGHLARQQKLYLYIRAHIPFSN